MKAAQTSRNRSIEAGVNNGERVTINPVGSII